MGPKLMCSIFFLTYICTSNQVTSFSLTPTINVKSGFKDCTTPSGKEGRCVHESFCNKDHQIEDYGNILFSELRSLECNKDMEWCCFDKMIINTTIPPSPPGTVKACRVSNKADCPWCVKLYRDGDDDYKLDSGFFCMGTMIGSKVVLTTGSCMLQAQGKQVWARVPTSASPNANYNVDRRILHPDFNSGTRAYDLALFVLDNEVQWGPDGAYGACLGVKQKLDGYDLMGAGIDDDENITLTPLIVYQGVCRGGDKVDASCGHAISEECNVMPGAPIMRPIDGKYMVVGVSKENCRNTPPRALLGNLNLASSWLHTHLTSTLGLSEKEFLYKP